MRSVRWQNAAFVVVPIVLLIVATVVVAHTSTRANATDQTQATANTRVLATDESVGTTVPINQGATAMATVTEHGQTIVIDDPVHNDGANPTNVTANSEAITEERTRQNR